MRVKCPECKSEYNLELNDAVIELNFTCLNCGVEFKVRNDEGKESRPSVIPSNEDTKSEVQPLSHKPKSLKGLRIATLITFIVFLVSLVVWGIQHRSEQVVEAEVPNDSLFVGLVANWDEMHRLKSFNDAAKCPYAETVKFYGMTMSGVDAAKKKDELLKAKPDFQQESLGVQVSHISADTVRCVFDKRTSSNGRSKLHPSYLVFIKESDGIWRIAEESDKETDYNLTKRK